MKPVRTVLIMSKKKGLFYFCISNSKKLIRDLVSYHTMRPQAELHIYPYRNFPLIKLQKFCH